MTGPAPIFEGEKGSKKLVSGPLRELKLPAADSGLPKDDFMILRTSIKFWPPNITAKAQLKPTLKLRTQIKDWAEIESVLGSRAMMQQVGHSSAVNRRNGARPAARQPTIAALHRPAALADGDVSAKQFDSERSQIRNCWPWAAA